MRMDGSDTPPKKNITKEKKIFFLGSMFKNAQPYMLQFHVKESHIHFWTFFDQKDGWLFSRIWRWFCKHGIKKRGEFLMVDRFYVCFYSDRFWLAKPLPLRFYLLFRGFLSHGLCWQMMQFITVLIALTPGRNNTDPKKSSSMFV